MPRLTMSTVRLTFPTMTCFTTTAARMMADSVAPKAALASKSAFRWEDNWKEIFNAYSRHSAAHALRSSDRRSGATAAFRPADEWNVAQSGCGRFQQPG